MAHDRLKPSCAHCGERVGVYERLWFEGVDGTLIPSSVLNMRDDGVELNGLCLWHHDCLPAERVPER